MAGRLWTGNLDRVVLFSFHVWPDPSMIVYRESERVVSTRHVLREAADVLRPLTRGLPCDHAAVTDSLIRFGTLEAALVDALSPEIDGLSSAIEAARSASLALGHLFRCSARREAESVPGAARRALACVEALANRLLPKAVRLRVPEGFAYYALYPEAYLEAAERFLREARPERAVVIGLRSIGATLSAVVGAALEAEAVPTETLTLRPRGAPFERRPVLDAALAGRLAARHGAWFLIVDEGPGLSGSSFTGTAACLAELDIPESRIVLFPSWLPDADAFLSETARTVWPRVRKVHVPFEALWRDSEPVTGAQDLSGGQWRRLLYADEAEWPAVQPQHERRKYLRPDGARGQPVLLKFAGLGQHGAAKHALAERLAERGFAPPVLGLDHGFLVTAFMPGRPLARRDLDRDLLAMAARYIAARREISPVEEPLRLDELLAVVENNVRWGLDVFWLDRLGSLERVRALFADVPAVAMDGRMLPHEWLSGPSGLIKTDGVDHHDDHFFPGTQDIGWDVAGFAVEFGLHRAATDELAAVVATRIRDRALVARIPSLTIAYLALRLGYARLAATTLGDAPDGHRQAKLARRYAWQLRRAILAWEAAEPRRTTAVAPW